MEERKRGGENDRKKELKGEEMERMKGRGGREALILTSLSGRPPWKTKNCIYSSETFPCFPLSIHSISSTINLNKPWDSYHLV